MTHFDRGEITREAFLAPRSSIVAPALVIALIAWFVISMVVAYRLDISLTQFLQSGNPKVLLNVGGAFGPSILDGEWWRLFTSGFVHVGAIHLAANCFSLILIGPVVEGLWGRWRFAGIYMLAGIAASFAATGLHPMAIVAGASGSIWGLQLATLAWLLRYREHIPRNVFSEWLRRLAVVLGVNIAISFVPGISWEGHFAGGIIGFIAAAFLDMIRPESGRRAIFLGIVGLITLIAATTAGFLATLRYSNDWHQLRALREPRSARPFPMNELRRIAPDRLGNAHATLLVAFTTGSVRNKESATEALDQLESDILSCRSSLTDVTGVIPKPFEEYLNALRDFIAMARPLLASAKIPGATETKPFGALRDRADTSWARLMEWMAKPENAR
jgi:membrane associated rhomboid family serine protease